MAVQRSKKNPSHTYSTSGTDTDDLHGQPDRNQCGGSNTTSKDSYITLYSDCTGSIIHRFSESERDGTAYRQVHRYLDTSRRTRGSGNFGDGDSTNATEQNTGPRVHLGRDVYGQSHRNECIGTE